MGKTPTKLQVSAGGVVFRKHNEQVQVVLISVSQEDRWQLPKGLMKQNESNESAAIREVREETTKISFGGQPSAVSGHL